ncbi:MAG: nodulation protein NfeD [Acidobacteria bacterium]|nr:nodulation protein NfeD [Acidobacteriota bacterium]MBA3885566.1 nodulation protein NfeD [Acidobacteriota bacterium]
MRTSVVSIVCGAVLLVLSAAVPAQEAAPLVYTAEIDGIIHPVAVEFIRGAVARADAAGAALLVISLRTPGGLADSTRDINTAIIQARTPVAVFVEPGGARAASAGFLITIAADIAAMAPGTHIGAAHPVSGSGETVDDTMSKKMVSDVAGYARTLAAQRKRNVELVELGVTESRTFTEVEALNAEPPLIDVVATDLADLLQQLDGRTITRFDGRTETLRTAGATLERVEQSWSQRVLGAIAHPQIAYLLLSLGILGLTIELWNPGAIFPGVVGGICLLLAFFALQVLPVSSAGVLLLLLGVVLLILEVKVTSFGLLAAGGVLSLFLGSLMLIDSPLPEMQIGLAFILPVVLGVSFLLLFLVRLAVQAQKQQSVTGVSGMVGEAGRALTAIEPGGRGSVQTRGEIWSATALEPIQQGDAVRVTAVSGLVLTVRPEAKFPAAGPEARATSAI